VPRDAGGTVSHASHGHLRGDAPGDGDGDG
jgi:hypothetical protein